MPLGDGPLSDACDDWVVGVNWEIIWMAEAGWHGGYIRGRGTLSVLLCSRRLTAKTPSLCRSFLILLLTFLSVLSRQTISCDTRLPPTFPPRAFPSDGAPSALFFPIQAWFTTTLHYTTLHNDRSPTAAPVPGSSTSSPAGPAQRRRRQRLDGAPQRPARAAERAPQLAVARRRAPVVRVAVRLLQPPRHVPGRLLPAVRRLRPHLPPPAQEPAAGGLRAHQHDGACSPSPHGFEKNTPR